MKLRLLALCLVLCLALAGCGWVRFPGADTTSATSTSSTPSGGSTGDEPTDRNAAILARQQEALADVADYDLDGRTFVIATTTPVRFGALSDDTQVISVAAHERNLMLRDRYNIQVITETYPDAASMFRAAKTASASGLYLADIYAIPYAEVGTYVAHGLLSSVYDLPYLNTDAFYFHSEVTRQSVLGTDAYAVCTAAEFTPAEYPAVFFQSSVTDYLEIDPYALLSQGKWTWDTLCSIADTATEAGYTGYTLAQSTELSLSLPELILRTGAVHPVTNKLGQTPVLDYGNRQTEKLFSLVQQVGSLFRATEPVEPSLFSAGGVLFYFDTLGAIDRLSATDYGVLPIPKYSNMQGGYTTMPTETLQVLTVPATVTQSLSALGQFLQCYAAVSYGQLQISQTDAWLRNALREEQALTVISYIMSATVRADLSDCFGSIVYDADGAPDHSALAACLTDGTSTLLSRLFAGTQTPTDAASAVTAKNDALQALLKQKFPFA